MIAQERYHSILTLLDQNELVKVQNLACRFNVSIETIRRDLEHLEKENMVKRVHGGAVKANHRMTISKFKERETENLEAKREIAGLVYMMLPENQMLFMDSSTTNLEIAKLLKEGTKKATIVTNSIVIATELSESQGLSVTLVGGKIDPDEQATFGNIAQENLRNFFADYALISTSGIMEKVGITDTNSDLGEIQRMMIHNADRTLILADSSKFDMTSNYRVAKLEDVHSVVTDSQLRDDLYNRYSLYTKIINR